LFAIGGAPAASHVVLSRVPSPDRLLDPLSGARVVSGTLFDALVAPLNVGNVLSRAVASAARPAAAEATGAEVRARVRELASRADGSSVVQRASLGSAHAVDVDRRRREPPTAGNLPTASRPSRRVDAATLSSIADGGSIPRTDGPRVGARSVPKPKDTRAVRQLPVVADYADRLGSASRVVVGSPSTDVTRLLAAADRGSQENASSVAPRPTSSENNAETSRLAAAVDRVRASRRAVVNAPAVASIDARDARERQLISTALDAKPSVALAPSTVRTDTVGGFRGLATRTLTSTRATSTVAPQRIEPESRIPGDIALDTLDARVEDSLARVLEREARRHGIDVDEARS
jgi:hypothetical protein